MREIFTYGSVGGAPGNRCFYPEQCLLLTSKVVLGSTADSTTVLSSKRWRFPMRMNRQVQRFDLLPESSQRQGED